MGILFLFVNVMCGNSYGLYKMCTGIFLQVVGNVGLGVQKAL